MREPKGVEITRGDYHAALTRFMDFCHGHDLHGISFIDFIGDDDSATNRQEHRDGHFYVTPEAKERIIILNGPHWRAWITAMFVKQGYL